MRRNVSTFETLRSAGMMMTAAPLAEGHDLAISLPTRNFSWMSLASIGAMIPPDSLGQQRKARHVLCEIASLAAAVSQHPGWFGGVPEPDRDRVRQHCNALRALTAQLPRQLLLINGHARICRPEETYQDTMEVLQLWGAGAIGDWAERQLTSSSNIEAVLRTRIRTVARSARVFSTVQSMASSQKRRPRSSTRIARSCNDLERVLVLAVRRIGIEWIVARQDPPSAKRRPDMSGTGHAATTPQLRNFG